MKDIFIVEVGAVELINRRYTGNNFHIFTLSQIALLILMRLKFMA